MKPITTIRMKRLTKSRMASMQYFPKLLPLGLLALVAGLLATSAAAPFPDDIEIPKSLGAITQRHKGDPSPLFVVIGETHVNLKVQQNVADLLGYFHGAFGLNLACVEGTDTFPEQAKWHALPSARARRTAADDLLRERLINGVEHFALCYPGTRVIGVEDMAAYRAHGQELDSLQARTKRWSEDFLKFLTQDLADVSVTREQGKQIEQALQDYLKTQNLDRLSHVLLEVLGEDSSKGKKLQNLADEHRANSRLREIVEGRRPSTEDPSFRRRDTNLVNNSRQAARGAALAALVIGKAHVSGVEALLRENRTSFVTVVPNGVEDDLSRNIDLTSGDTNQLRQLKAESDQYEKWKKGETWNAVEEFLKGLSRGPGPSRFKPPPSLARPSAADTRNLYQLLLAVEDLARSGETPAEIGRKMEPYREVGLRVREWHLIPGGVEVSVEKDGVSFWTVLTDGNVRLPESFTTRASTKIGGRELVVCSGGQQPPIPPQTTTAPSDPFGFNRHLNLLWFYETEGRLYRRYGIKARPLAISLSDLKRMMQDFETAMGSEKVHTAQEICDVLLVDLDADLTPNIQELVVTCQDDALKDYPLVAFAGWAGGKQYPRIISLVRNAVIRWNDAQDARSLENALSPPSVSSLAVWITEEIMSTEAGRDLGGQLRRRNIEVNRPLAAGASLLLFGTGKPAWQVSLDGRSMIGPPQIGGAIAQANGVASFGVALPEDLRIRGGSIMRAKAIAESRLREDATRLVERAERARGREPLEKAVREAGRGAAENSVKIGEILSRDSNTARAIGDLPTNVTLAQVIQPRTSG